MPQGPPGKPEVRRAASSPLVVRPVWPDSIDAPAASFQGLEAKPRAVPSPAVPWGCDVEGHARWAFQHVSYLEARFAIEQHTSGDTRLRLQRLAEQVERLQEALMDERHSRQVEVAEERMRRLEEVAELRTVIEDIRRACAHEAGPLPDPGDCDAAGVTAPWQILETFAEDSEEPEDEDDTQPQVDTTDGCHEEAKVLEDTLRPSMATSAAVSAGLKKFLASAARRCEARIRRSTVAAEESVRKEVDRAATEVRALLKDESWRASAKKVPQSSAVFPESSQLAPSGAMVTAECFGVRLDALEVHLHARLEAVEESISDKCDALSEKIQRQVQKVEADVRRGIELSRAEWSVALQIERQEAADRAQALGRTLREELQRSVVAQAVAEVRAEACVAAHEEVCRLRVEAESRLGGDGSGLNPGSVDAVRGNILQGADPPHVSDVEAEEPMTRLGSKEETAALSVGAVAIQQFGGSIARLESSITGLVKRNNEARVETQREQQRLRSDMEEFIASARAEQKYRVEREALLASRVDCIEARTRELCGGQRPRSQTPSRRDSTANARKQAHQPPLAQSAQCARTGTPPVPNNPASLSSAATPPASPEAKGRCIVGAAAPAASANSARARTPLSSAGAARKTTRGAPPKSPSSGRAPRIT